MARREKEEFKLSVVILNYQTNDLTVKLVEKICIDKTLEIVIVDNSPDNSLKNILPKKANVTYHFSGKNLGFARGNNFGAHLASSKWVCFLNSDVICDSESLVNLLDDMIMAQMSVGTVKLQNADGTFQKSVGYFDGLFKNILNYIFLRPRYLVQSPKEQKIKVDFANGTIFLIEQEVFNKVGGWDEKNFFMYFEDIDLSHRLKLSGYPILYDSSICLTHLGGQSKADSSFYGKSLNAFLVKNRGKTIASINSFLGILR